MQTPAFWQQQLALIRKEWQLEWRQKYALSGVLLYVVSAAFVVYMSLGQQVGPAIWISLFWLVFLFASVNAVAKSFVQEPASRQLYYYTLAQPLAVLYAKIIYNASLLFLIALLSLFVFSLVLGNPMNQLGLFVASLGLGSLGFSIAFTFISAISAKARQSATLMAVLSFPVILPNLLTLLRLSKIAAELMSDSAYYRDMFLLLAIDAILLSLASLLFPILWRD